jgi:nicotinamidase-related amidase
MPLTQVDPVAALIVIDLQKGVAAIPTAHPSSEIIERAAQLARAFRMRKLPVVLVNVTAAAPGRTDAPRHDFTFPEGWADLVAELDQQPEDYLVSKQRRGAFIGTALHEYLQSRGVTQVFVTGISTSAGVQATAFSASDHGYNVVLVVDAMTDRELDTHAYCVEKVFPKLGETETTENVLKALEASGR